MLSTLDEFLEQLGVYSVLGWLLACIPKDSELIVYTSYPNFSDSVKTYFEVCRREYPHKKHVWIQVRSPFLKAPRDIQSFGLYSLSGLYCFLRAKVIFTNNNEFYRFKSRNQILIDFWHGTPIKNILNFDATLPGTPKVHAYKTDHRVSPSRFVTMLLSAAFGNAPESYLEVGSLRADVILTSNTDKTRNKLNLSNGSRIALYVPTYRSGYRSKSDGDEGLVHRHYNDMQRVFADLGYALLVKPHPFEEEKYKDLNACIIDNAYLVKNELSTNDLLAVADVLISDYCSLIIDFLITSKPLVIFAPDGQVFSEKRGFLFPIFKFLKNVEVNSVNDVPAVLESQLNGEGAGQLEYLKELYYDYEDAESGSRLTTCLKKIYPDVF